MWPTYFRQHNGSCSLHWSQNHLGGTTLHYHVLRFDSRVHFLKESVIFFQSHLEIRKNWFAPLIFLRQLTNEINDLQSECAYLPGVLSFSFV